MLKQYLVSGKQYQYEEGKQPNGAVELGAEPEKPAKKPEAADKARAVKNK